MTDSNATYANGRPILMVDVDDTLYEFKGLFCNLAMQIYGMSIDPDEHDVWACLWDAMKAVDEREGEAVGACFQVVLDACFTQAAISRNAAMSGAAGVLRRLARIYDIWYVSDRPETAKGHTQDWLRAGAFPCAEQLVCTADKREWMLERKGQIETIIDDRPRTLIFALRQLGCAHVHGMRQRWNSDLTDVDDVHLAGSWQQLGETIMNFNDAQAAA